MFFSDEYVQDKLGNFTIRGRDRCQLCELAIEEHEREENNLHWLQVSRAECEYSDGFVDFGPVTEALDSYLNVKLCVEE